MAKITTKMKIDMLEKGYYENKKYHYEVQSSGEVIRIEIKNLNTPGAYWEEVGEWYYWEEAI